MRDRAICLVVSRVLVTGALGNVGREVARACVLQGFVVRVADRSIAALAKRFGEMETVAFDFLDRETWASALADCQWLFLLRPPPLGDMKTTLDPFIDVAFAAGVEHIVFLSVAGAERMRWVPHHEVERHLRTTGRSWSIVRPGFFAQNLQDAYRRDIIEDARLYVPAARGRVAFIDVRDVADITARIFADPQAFAAAELTLTGPAAMRFDEVATLLSTTLGREIRYEPASILGYLWHLRTRRALSWTQAIVQLVLHVGLRRGDAERVEPTVAAILGRPARSVAEYVADAHAIWRT